MEIKFVNIIFTMILHCAKKKKKKVCYPECEPDWQELISNSSKCSLRRLSAVFAGNMSLLLDGEEGYMVEVILTVGYDFVGAQFVNSGQH